VLRNKDRKRGEGTSQKKRKMGGDKTERIFSRKTHRGKTKESKGAGMLNKTKGRERFKKKKTKI